MLNYIQITIYLLYTVYVYREHLYTKSHNQMLRETTNIEVLVQTSECECLQYPVLKWPLALRKE